MAPPSSPVIRRRPKARSGTLQFFWSPPLSDGGSALTAYVLECSAISYSQMIDPSYATYTVDSLTNGTDYTFTIKAQNADGDSDPVSFLTVQPGNFPDPPENAVPSPVGQTGITFQWDAPISTGGADIRFYVTHAINQTTPGVSTIKKSIYGNKSTTFLGGLDASSTYVFKLFAVNDPGYSIPVTLYSVPTDPDLVVLLRAFQYSGSGTWYDESGLDNNALVEDGTPSKNIAGNGVVLDGASSFALAPIGVLSNWTLNAWFKQTGTPGLGACLITDIYTGSGYINFCIKTGDNAIPLEEWGGAMFSAAGWYEETPIDGWSNWKNIQITWNGTYMKTYVNGAFVHETDYTGVGSSGPNVGTRIGRRWDAAYYAVGELGEVRIYSRALNAGEVATAYAQSASIFI